MRRSLAYVPGIVVRHLVGVRSHTSTCALMIHHVTLVLERNFFGRNQGYVGLFGLFGLSRVIFSFFGKTAFFFFLLHCPPDGTLNHPGLLSLSLLECDTPHKHGG